MRRALAPLASQLPRLRIGHEAQPAVPPHPEQHPGGERVPADRAAHQPHAGLGEPPAGVARERAARRPPSGHQVLGEEGQHGALVSHDLVVRRGVLGPDARARRARTARRRPRGPRAARARGDRGHRRPGALRPGPAPRRSRPSARSRASPHRVAAAASDTDRPGDERGLPAVQRPAGVVRKADPDRCPARIRRWPRTAAAPACSG